MNVLNYAKECAKEEGRAEGKNEAKIEIARKSLKRGLDIETIKIITGLSTEEIKNLE